MRQVKTYPLEVRQIIVVGSCDMLLGYYSQGHHDPVLFLAALDAEYDVGADYGVQPVDRVTHEWWRTVPLPAEWELDAQFVPAPGPGPGAYPVTVWSKYPEEHSCAD